jgi:SAM-dependent methyltransferase
MDSVDDAYGRLIFDYSQGKPAIEAVERDDGFIDFSESLPAGYFAKFENWPAHEKKSIQYAQGRVLDIGLGAGRHSLYLQSKGHNVTAIDSSPLAVRVSKRRGVVRAKIMRIHEIKKFKPASFDTILMLGNNFGLFGSASQARLLLRTMYRITTDDAMIIAETTDPYKTKNPDHLRYHALNRSRGRMPCQIRMRIRYRTYIGKWFDYLFVSKKELIGILRGTGWRLMKTIDSKGPQYIAILKKGQ